MEPNQIIEYRWCTIRQQMIQQRIETPQGTQIIQQPINIPVFFKDDKEVMKFLNEQRALGRSEVTVHIGARDISEECEWYYGPHNNTERTKQ